MSFRVKEQYNVPQKNQFLHPVDMSFSSCDKNITNRNYDFLQQIGQIVTRKQ